MSLSSVSLDPCHHSECERSPPPQLSDSCRQLTEIMADRCETKHIKTHFLLFLSFVRVFFFCCLSSVIPFSQSLPCGAQLHELIACAGSDVLITGSLLTTECTRTLRNFYSRVNSCGLSPAHKGPSFWQSISIFLSGILKITQCH